MPRKQDNTDLETSPTSETAAPAIPPGVQADVNIKYKTHVDPNQAGNTRDRQFQSMLDAAEELEAEDTAPLDELSTFCYRFAQFAGYPLRVVRLPDPPGRLMPGNNYVRRCSTMEQLGAITFDPTNVIQSLQSLNRDSGGIFRVWLTDYDGAPILDARIMVLGIADPPRDQITTTPAVTQQQTQQLAPPALREKSESEKQLETVKDTLFQAALSRALNPPTPPALTGAPGSQLPPEDQATLFLLGKTDFLGNIFGKMADLAAQTANVTKEPSWKERAIDAGLQLATNNPAIVDRLSGVVERIIARVLPDPRYDAIATQPPPQQFAYRQPQSQSQSQQPGRAFTHDPGPPDAPTDEDEDEDMDIIDSLLTLLNSNKPLALSDPLFTELRSKYPMKFRMAIGAIASQPLDVIINWIKDTGGPPYVMLLDGPASGPYLRQRLNDLQQLIIAANNKAKQTKENATQPTQANEANAQPDS